jgi:large subunit ribosomal protein L4
MPELEIKDMDNKASGTVKLPEEIFGLKRNDGLMHAAVVNYLANKRQGTHATKTKGLVSGGGKKPWKQKGTGRARAGSNRSPLWRGGGTIFGPTPRDYRMHMPREERKQALYAALSAKAADGEVVVVGDLKLEGPKTKDMVQLINNLELAGGSLLVVLPAADRNVALSARNIPGVHVAKASDLNAYDVLAHRKLLFTKGAVDALASQEAGA